MMSVQGCTLAYSIIVLSVLASVHAGGYSEGIRVPSRRRVYTSVSYDEPADRRVHVTHEVHHVVHKKRKRKRVRVRPVLVRDEVVAAPIHPVSGLEGSYVAVSGEPGRGSLHVVENVASLGRDSVTVVNGRRIKNKAVAVVPVPVATPAVHLNGAVVGGGVPPPVPLPNIKPGLNTPLLPAAAAARPDGVSGDRLPLPKCSYLNTDFPGDDLDLNLEDGEGFQRGVNAGSARACKALCRLEEDCSFWTYREGFNRDINARDCFLKQGTPGLPVPREAVPRIGFVSGTKDNNCVCIMSDDEEDEVCPLKNPKGLVYPWRSTDQSEDDELLSAAAAD